MLYPFAGICGFGRNFIHRVVELRTHLERTPKKCWEETREAYGRRLKRCCDDVNQTCDVEGPFKTQRCV